MSRVAPTRGHGLLVGDEAASAVHVANQQTIHTTATHPWLTADRGWVPAGDLKVGEQVVTLNGTTSTVQWAHAASGQADMYNLTVAHDHTYSVADGQAVVHNIDWRCAEDRPAYNRATQYRPFSDQSRLRPAPLSPILQLRRRVRCAVWPRRARPPRPVC
jgi:hypothetical protein